MNNPDSVIKGYILVNPWLFPYCDDLDLYRVINGQPLMYKPAGTELKELGKNGINHPILFAKSTSYLVASHQFQTFINQHLLQMIRHGNVSLIQQAILVFMKEVLNRFYSQRFNFPFEALEEYVEYCVQEIQAVKRLKWISQADMCTATHSLAVMSYSISIASSLGADNAQIKQVAMGALLHDLGEIWLPRAILLAPRALSDEERRQMKEHVGFSDDLIKYSNCPRMQLSREMIRQHHERNDGSGYPANLLSSEICFGAKLLAVADTYDALTNKRPYRDFISPEAACEIIRQEVDNNRLDKESYLALSLGLD